MFNEMVRTEFNILQIQSCRVQPGSVKPAKGRMLHIQQTTPG
uniref:Uncharacterized protein n=1 Tax=Klebsiella oxytoca TaxID=571 RepID=A0A345WXK1_KLEOX|nr:hypothetical protein [Klebsiella oxytoca]